MKYPIKVLMDKDKKPFIPFVPTSAIVENGTGKTLEEILANLAVPIVNLTSLDSDSVAVMMTKMEQYKDVGFSIIYVGAESTGVLFTYSSQTTADALNKTWTFVSGFDTDGNAHNLHVTGYYNTETKTFTCSNVDLVAGISNEVGNLESLETTDKSSVVNAINEVKTLIDNKQCKLIAIKGSIYLNGYTGDVVNIDSTLRTAILNEINKNLDTPILVCLQGSVNNNYTMAFFSGTFNTPTTNNTQNVIVPGFIEEQNDMFTWNVKLKLTQSQYSKKYTGLTFSTNSIAWVATTTYVNDRLKTIDLSAYATTEYVDEQIGDINAILATITTPEVS